MALTTGRRSGSKSNKAASGPYSAREVLETTKAARADEVERCLGLIRRYLLYHSQRPVSWHEVVDCMKAIANGEMPRERDNWE